MLDAADLQQIVSAHDTRVADWRTRVQAWRHAYQVQTLTQNVESKTWVGTQAGVVETPDAFADVESYVASLFVKAPAVQSSPSVDGRGNHDAATKLVNAWLPHTADELKMAMRWALIDGCAAMKLSWSPAPMPKKKAGQPAPEPYPFDPVHGVDCVPLAWDELLVDLDAKRWQDQRWVGHVYDMSLAEAKQEFGGKRWSLDTGDLVDGRDRDIDGLSDTTKTVRIYEIYDLTSGRIVHYSPHAERGDRIVSTAPIPFDDGYGGPCVPIVPMYFFYNVAGQRLTGWSCVQRGITSYRAKALLRTATATAVARNARINLARAGTLDDKAKTQIADNQDGTTVEVNITPGQSLRDVVQPLEQARVNPDVERLEAMLQADLDRGSVLAPFTKGKASNASATEIAVLAEYTATEIGNHAHSRDIGIRMLASVYLSIIRWALRTEAVKTIQLMVEGRIEVVTESMLTGRFQFQPADSASTPVSRGIRKTEAVQLAPLLIQLGADPLAVGKYIGDLHDLPVDDLFPEPDAGPAEEVVDDGAPTPVEEAVAPPVGGGAVAAALRAPVQP